MATQPNSARPILTPDHFTYRIPHFFDLLSQLDTSIPIESQWVVYIQHIPEGVIEQVKQYEAYRGADAWTNIAPCISHAAAAPLQKIKGCIFANQVNIPGESIEVQRAGEGYRGGYVKGPLTPNRVEFANFTVNFLETNFSFGDLVIRPWTIMVSHLGLMVRESEAVNPETSLKTNIIVYHLAKAGYGKNPIVRKQFNFYNCVPVSVSNDEYNSEPAGQTKMRQVDFLYSYYTTDMDPALLRQPQAPPTAPTPGTPFVRV